MQVKSGPRRRSVLAAVAIALVALSPAEADTRPVVVHPTISLDALGLGVPRTGGAVVIGVVSKPGREDQGLPQLAFLQLSDDGVTWRTQNTILIYIATGQLGWLPQDIYPADALPPVPAIFVVLGGAELMVVSLPAIDAAYGRLEVTGQRVDLLFDPNWSQPDLSGAISRYTDELRPILQSRDCRGALRRIAPKTFGTSRLRLERWDGRAWTAKETAAISTIRRSLTKRCSKKADLVLFRVGTPGAWFHFIAPK